MNANKFIERGVIIPCPASVEIDDAMDPKQIAPGVVIHTGCKIVGTQTSIGPGCEIGAEAPAAIENCQLGKDVSLGGGFFSGATFLNGVQIGSGAHVRSGTLLEEESKAAHTVGFKQTILFPFVTAGSLINFCDCLMAGGTGSKDHSEIGSSYIHFNFTPRQDKATASLIGDVPRGVMLDQTAIFLGGQGGLVGPARIAYGTIIPAGSICRRDVLVENQMVAPPAIAGGEPQKNNPGQYFGIRRIVVNNLIYIGNLHALKAWYRLVRKKFMSSDSYGQACWKGAIRRIDEAIAERIRRLDELAAKMPRSIEIGDAESNLPKEIRLQQERFIGKWPSMRIVLEQDTMEKIDAVSCNAFHKEWETVEAKSYLESISILTPAAKAKGTAWLQSIVDLAAAQWDDK
jgi:UDP-N-acetylglucosamine/UDP-N-acetylgalactosamine diphosphorylase